MDRRWWVATAAAGVVVVVVIRATGMTDHVQIPAPRACASALVSVHWGFLVALAALSVLHYVLAALSLKGVALCRLPLGEATLTQFTAAAANRVTPGGLGAAAVNTRYLVCRGMSGPRAVTAVAVLQVAGAVADLLLLLAIAGASSGGAGVLTALGGQVSAVLGALPLIPLLTAGAVLVLVAGLWGGRAARSAAARHAVTGMAELIRRPGDLCLTVVSSAATTLVLGLALALSVLAVPGGAAGPGDIMALVTAYMIGAAAGATLPSPGGIGGTESALVATLATAGVAAAPAIQAVLLFRAVTYWAPVPVGLLTTRTLHRKSEKVQAPPVGERARGPMEGCEPAGTGAAGPGWSAAGAL